MNKYESIFVCILLLSVGLTKMHAQIGVRAGLGVSDITFKDEGQTPYLGYEINSIEHRLPLVTFQVGVFTSFEVGPHFDFQPELLLVSQGLDYSTERLYDDIEYKIKSTYLQLPLLMKYRTAVKKNKLSGIMFGPYAAIRLNANRITEIEGVRQKSELNNINPTDFGLILGYDFDFNIASGKTLINLRTGYSLVNIMERI